MLFGPAVLAREALVTKRYYAAKLRQHIAVGVSPQRVVFGKIMSREAAPAGWLGGPAPVISQEEQSDV